MASRPQTRSQGKTKFLSLPTTLNDDSTHLHPDTLRLLQSQSALRRQKRKLKTLRREYRLRLAKIQERLGYLEGETNDLWRRKEKAELNEDKIRDKLLETVKRFTKHREFEWPLEDDWY